MWNTLRKTFKQDKVSFVTIRALPPSPSEIAEIPKLLISFGPTIWLGIFCLRISKIRIVNKEHINIHKLSKTQKTNFCRKMKTRFKEHSVKFFMSLISYETWVLIYYLCTDFGGYEKPKGGTLGKRKFCCWGGLTKGVGGGVRSLLKPSSAFLINKKLKFQNLYTDNREIPKPVSHQGIRT